MFQRFSPHLWLVALRGSQPQAESPARTLRISPGGAFPPTHPTTRLCLDMLREILLSGPVNSLLDVGCGTGVLALAAAALGAALVMAVDISGPAARTTLENAHRNRLPVKIVQGSTECLKGRFDLVAANLPWEVQMDKAPELDRLAAPSGLLILSGFRDSQEAPLMETYQKLGWSRARRLLKDFQHPELPAGLSFTWVAWSLKRTSA